MVEAPPSEKVPPYSTRLPRKFIEPATAEPEIVITAPGSNWMFTSSAAVGTTLVLQLPAVFQSPPALATHSLLNCRMLKWRSISPRLMALPARSAMRAVSMRRV